MIFNSNFFIYIFLPALLILFYLSVYVTRGQKFGNYIILLFSLLFYICTGGWCTLILLGVVILNYMFGIVMESSICERKNNRKIVMILAVVCDIGILGYFKYASFVYENFAYIAKIINSEYVTRTIDVVLPVGISFFTFQALSYVIDVYRGEVIAQRNIFKFALYLTLFPQLVAGPIVRYSTVCEEIEERRITIEGIYDGLFRFVFGLGKKVLIADCLGTAVDKIWNLSLLELTTPLAWSAAFLYTLQIYFDFSGYSDMAIGLGRMLGFHFQENFERPYTSSNINEFWKRWHISLSSFLKDYLYIPLGGNRKGAAITYRNLVIVFLVCGLWHGAAWNFIIWGVYHGIFQVIERLLRQKCNFQIKGILGRIVTFFIVMMGWVLFRATSLKNAFDFYGVMFGRVQISDWQYYTYNYYIYFKIIVVGIFAFVVSFFPLTRTREILSNTVVKGIGIIFILILSMAYMSDASFTPFIYFQF